jgi:hypothetical protein
MNFNFTSGRGIVFDDSTYTDDELLLMDTWDLGTVESLDASRKAPYSDGEGYYGTTLAVREMIIPYVLFADSRADLFTAIRTVKNAFQPKDGLGLLLVTLDGGVERAIWCKPTGEVKTPGGASRGTWYQEVYVNLRAYYPFFIDPELKSATLASFSGGLTMPFTTPVSLGIAIQQVTITNSGDSPTPITVTFQGEITNPRIDNLTTGEYIKATMTLGSGEFLRINTGQGQHTVRYIHGTTDERGNKYLDSGSKFFWLEPGSNVLSFSSSSSLGAGSGCVIEYFDQYLGVES